MVDFFRHKILTRCHYPISTILTDLLNECRWSFPTENMLTFGINPLCTARRVFFSNLSLNITVNFMEWNCTDLGEIFQTLILARCLNLEKKIKKIGPIITKPSVDTFMHPPKIVPIRWGHHIDVCVEWCIFVIMSRVSVVWLPYIDSTDNFWLSGDIFVAWGQVNLLVR